MTTRRVAALILAAGRGTRFGAGPAASKTAAPFAGVPMVRRVASAALASRACAVLVVTGHAAPSVARAVEGLPVALVHNADYAAGLAGSLRAGLAALPSYADGVLVLLADMPQVAPTTLNTLISAFDTAPHETEAIVPYYDGRPGNPLLLARGLFPRLSDLDGDHGARSVLEAEGRPILRVACADDGILADIDTPEDLRARNPG